LGFLGVKVISNFPFEIKNVMKAIFPVMKFLKLPETRNVSG
jgi:hypothetical protein